MLGISLQKIAVFVGLIGAVWAIYRVVHQIGRTRDVVERKKPGRAVAQDMKECPECGTFVAPAAALDCGRPRCPYPRAAA